MGAIAALTLVAPEFGYQSRYRLDDTGVGEQGRLQEYEVTVTSIRLTRSIEKYSDVLNTDDAFVVLAVQAVVYRCAQPAQCRAADQRCAPVRPQARLGFGGSADHAARLHRRGYAGL